METEEGIPEEFVLDLYVTHQFAFESIGELNEATEIVARFAKRDALERGFEESQQVEHVLRVAYSDYLLTLQ